MENDCIISEWKDVDKKGYARRDKLRAHRVAYEKAYGPIPKGMYVCHTCDNPPCIEPKHLWLGTPADNSRDMRNKGRSAKGSKNGAAKLTEMQVRKIKILLEIGHSIRSLARKFNVYPNAIYIIKSKKGWKHV